MTSFPPRADGDASVPSLATQELATEALTRWLTPPAPAVLPRWVRALLVTMAGFALASLLGFALGLGLLALFFLTATGLLALVGLYARHLVRTVPPVSTQEAYAGMSPALMRALINAGDPVPLALTRGDGSLLCANTAYEAFMGGFVDPVAVEDKGWQVQRCGDDRLLWRQPASGRSALLDPRALVEESWGSALSQLDCAVALVSANGEVRTCNEAWRQLSVGGQTPSLPALFAWDEQGAARVRTGAHAGALVRLSEVAAAESGASDSPGDMVMLARVLDPPVMLAGESSGTSAGGTSADKGGVQESTDLLSALIDRIPVPLLLVTPDGKIRHFNAGVQDLVGEEQGLSLCYVSDLVAEADKMKVANVARRVAAGASAQERLTIKLMRRDDQGVSLTLVGLKGLGGGALALLRDDLSEERWSQQIAQVSRMQAVGQLAGGVAHDFNNILTAIIGCCDLMLLRHAPGEADFGDLTQIKQNANRAATLVRQLLAFSRQQTLRPERVLLPELVSNLAEMLRRLIGAPIKLDLKFARDAGAVRADPGQLEQVVTNLVVNARDAMPEGGVVTIETRRLPAAQVARLGKSFMPVADYVMLSVTDTGTGIKRSDLPHIFEPFFTTKDVGKGTGLGLATVYGVVKQTGGFIFADSTPGKGTCFTVYLPEQGAELEGGEEAAPTVASLAAAPTIAGLSWGRAKVLLVEDEALVRAVAERALALAGYDVVTAENGDEGFEIFHKNPDAYQLVISDVVMPGMDGPALLRAVRALRPQVKAILMSGYAEETLRDTIEGANVGFLGKPFSVASLTATVRTALS